MLRSFPLGTIGGVALRVHWSVPVVVVLFGLIGLELIDWNAAGWGMTFILLIYASVLAHELGHMLAANLFGVRSSSVTLWPVGGVTLLERQPETPQQDIVVSLAGPAVNIVIGSVLFGLLLWPVGLYDTLDYVSVDVLYRLMAINFVLAMFNLLPVFPMDGGRILRAALTLKFGIEKAVKLAAMVGMAFAFGFAVLGSFHGPLLILFGAFAGFVSWQAWRHPEQECAKDRYPKDRYAKDQCAQPVEVAKPVSVDILDIKIP